MIIKITFDPDGAYGYPKNEIINGKQLVNDYIDTLNEVEDADTINFIHRSEIEKSVDFIAKAWNLSYDVVFDIQEFNIQTPLDVGRFFAWIVFEKHINFHPDDSFGDYEDTETYEPLFSQETADYYDKTMRQCFDICEKYDRDIYEISRIVSGMYCYCTCNDEMATFFLKR